TIQGLGQFGGFDMYLQDRTGAGYEKLVQAEHILLAKAAQNEALAQVRPNNLADSPQLKLEVDRTQAQSMGLSVSDVYNVIQLMLAPVYVNDFFHDGRIKRVTMQAQAPFRMGPDALSHFYTPAPNADVSGESDGSGMIPLSNVVNAKWIFGLPNKTRYNGYSGIEIVCAAAP